MFLRTILFQFVIACLSFFLQSQQWTMLKSGIIRNFVGFCLVSGQHNTSVVLKECNNKDPNQVGHLFDDEILCMELSNYAMLSSFCIQGSLSHI